MCRRCALEKLKGAWKIPKDRISPAPWGETAPRQVQESMKLTLAVAAVLLLGSCSPHEVTRQPLPAVVIPENFQGASDPTDDEVQVPRTTRWWEEFGDPGLNGVVDRAIENNLDLRQAWSRLRQSIALARIAGSERFPAVDISAGASLTRTVDRDRDTIPGFRGIKSDDTDERYFIGGALSYEIDVWRRIASQRQAAESRVSASREDVESTALILSGTAAGLWFTILEQTSLVQLLDRQVATSEQFLELTELRFSLGQGSAVDVLQQRQQVAARNSELPLVRSALEVSKNSLAVLLGEVPGSTLPPPASELPTLPPFPSVFTPAELFNQRPDLRSEMLRLEATDYDVAVAVADRFPRIGISLSYEFSGNHLGDIFERELGSLLGNIVAPILDGGRRRAEVERRRALVQEQLDRFGLAFLNAMLEIENAIVEEKYQKELIDRLEEEVELGRLTLAESRSRYANALDDYLSVLVALQSLQALERRLVSEQTRLLLVRSDLYRALGGKGWTESLDPPETEPKNAQTQAPRPTVAPRHDRRRNT